VHGDGVKVFKFTTGDGWEGKQCALAKKGDRDQHVWWIMAPGLSCGGSWFEGFLRVNFEGWSGQAEKHCHMCASLLLREGACAGVHREGKGGTWACAVHRDGEHVLQHTGRGSMCCRTRGGGAYATAHGEGEHMLQHTGRGSICYSTWGGGAYATAHREGSPGGACLQHTGRAVWERRAELLFEVLG